MNSIVFVLQNGSSYKFKMTPEALSFFSQNFDFFNKLISQHQYHVESDVSYENFKEFMEFFQEGKFPENIIYGKIEDFYLLSHEFNYHVEECEAKMKSPAHMIERLIDPKVGDHTIAQNYLIENIDICINEFSESLIKVPINHLFIMFNKAQIKDHDKAYHFIISAAEKTENSNFFTLLPSIDASKFKEYENIQDAINKSNERFGFLPSNIKISELDEKLTQMSQKLSETEEKNKEISQKLSEAEEFKQRILELGDENKFIEIIQQNQDLKQKLEEAEKSKEDLERRLADLKNNNFSLANKLFEMFSKRKENQEIFFMFFL